jgi:23S rRNA (cytosine1962-C5)-methyltransferase
MAEIFSSSGEKLGIAMLNKGRSILGHMLAFGSETVSEALRQRIASAIEMRKNWFDPSHTNAFRLIHAEGDGLPGLIVDMYRDILVVQVANPGMEKLKGEIVDLLIELVKPRSIYEKSTSFMRRKEGLEEVRALLYGENDPEVEILEYGLKFSVNVLEGQKTGFFLDQREMRALVRNLSKGRKVLNCFAYTGGFSIAALKGGAQSVDSVEISEKCASRIEKNLALNHLENHRFICEDVFDFLKTSSLDYDLIVLDPPAFVKKREDIAKAFRAYKDLNAHVIRNMPKGSILLTCSCSYHVSEDLFQNILFRASHEAKRHVRIIEKHRQAHDHAISIFHPESSYLKSLFLYID